MADPTQSVAAVPDAVTWAISLAGSIVGLRGMPGASWLERAFNLVCGTLTAGFVGPLLVGALGLSNHGVAGGVLFLTGSVGLIVLHGLITGFRAVAWDQVVSDLIDRVKGLLPKRS